MTTDRQETPAPIRINLRRGVHALLWTLVLPVGLAVAADWLAGSLPWVTMAAALICIPLATVVVSRTVLAEFDRVVALVAPPEAAEDDSGGAGAQASAQAPAEPVDSPSAAAASAALADSLPTDWPLDGQPFTEGAQRHHG